MDKRKLIIDTDPGIEDAIAIMLINASEVFDIKALTTVYGNASLNQASLNTMYLTQLYSMNCPIAVGANRAMVKSVPFDEKQNGRNGLGNFRYPNPKRRLHDRWAWELIYETALESDNELEILTLGPLTNIAIALLKYPNLKDMIKTIYIRAGAATIGNVSPYAEFNIYQDPYAASVVLNSGINRIVMIDLDCCMDVYLSDSDCDRMLILKSKLGPMYEALWKYKRKFQKEYIDRYFEVEDNLKGRNIFFDAVASAVATDETITGLKSVYVTCETQSSINYGQTVFDWNNRLNMNQNVELVRGVNQDRFKEMFQGSFSFYMNEKAADEVNKDAEE